MKLSALMSFVALAAFAAATPVKAEPFEFRYQSFELETNGGRDAMMTRLDRSIDRYCRANSVRGLSARKAAAECSAEMKEQLIAQLEGADFAQLDR